MGERWVPIARDESGRWRCAECGAPVERIADVGYCCAEPPGSEPPPDPSVYSG